MVFEYILNKNGIDPKADLTIDQSIDFGSTAAAFSGGQGIIRWSLNLMPRRWRKRGTAMWQPLWGRIRVMCPIPPFLRRKVIWRIIRRLCRHLQTHCRREWDYVASHTPAEIAEVIAPQFPETELATITTIVERYHNQDTWKTDLIFEEESFMLLQNILKDSKVLEETVPYEDLVTTEFAKKAASQ